MPGVSRSVMVLLLLHLGSACESPPESAWISLPIPGSEIRVEFLSLSDWEQNGDRSAGALGVDGHGSILLEDRVSGDLWAFGDAGGQIIEGPADLLPSAGFGGSEPRTFLVGERVSGPTGPEGRVRTLALEGRSPGPSIRVPMDGPRTFLPAPGGGLLELKHFWDSSHLLVRDAAGHPVDTLVRFDWGPALEHPPDTLLLPLFPSVALWAHGPGPWVAMASNRGDSIALLHRSSLEMVTVPMPWPPEPMGSEETGLLLAAWRESIGDWTGVDGRRVAPLPPERLPAIGGLASISTGDLLVQGPLRSTDWHPALLGPRPPDWAGGTEWTRITVPEGAITARFELPVPMKVFGTDADDRVYGLVRIPDRGLGVVRFSPPGE